MQEVFENIAERVNFKNKTFLIELLDKCLHLSYGLTKTTSDKKENVVFKIDALFKRISSVVNEYGKDKQYIAGAELINAICEEIGIDLDKEDCFILFHIRNLGKYKIREEKLFEELKKEWKCYPDFELDGQEFSHSLKRLMKKNFINYRKRNLHLKNSVVIRYRK